jgi:uncharacterized membrane-anchored protein
METEYLPRLESRYPDTVYWCLLALAGIFGANAGDVFTQLLGLGRGMVLLSLLPAFGAILAVERFDRGRPYLCFWLLLLVVRIVAGTLCDIGRGLQPHGPAPVLAVTAVLLATLYGWRFAPSAPADIPAVHPLFWWTMLVAGTLGSMLGDCLAEELAVGHVVACIAPAALVPLLLLAARGYGSWRFALYWLVVVALHGAGNAAADLFAREVLSLALSTVVFGVAFGLSVTALRILPDSRA